MSAFELGAFSPKVKPDVSGTCPPVLPSEPTKSDAVEPLFKCGAEDITKSSSPPARVELLPSTAFAKSVGQRSAPRLVDLTGKRFGLWEVLSFAGRHKWLCLCHGCGREYSIRGDTLRDGYSTRCQPCRKNKPVSEIIAGINIATNSGSILRANLEKARQHSQILWREAYLNGGKWRDETGQPCAVFVTTNGHYFIVDEIDAEVVSTLKCKAAAGPKSKTLYVFIYYRGGTTRSLHRFLLNAPSSHLDHRNQNGLDNRRSNLRPASQGQNNANTPLRSHNSTGYKGVRIENGRFLAQIAAGGRNRRIGSFLTAVEAAKAYDEAAKELHGEFAFLNFPERGTP